MFCRLGCRLIQTNVKFCVIDRDTLARYNPGKTREHSQFLLFETDSIRCVKGTRNGKLKTPFRFDFPTAIIDVNFVLSEVMIITGRERIKGVSGLECRTEGW